MRIRDRFDRVTRLSQALSDELAAVHAESCKLNTSMGNLLQMLVLSELVQARQLQDALLAIQGCLKAPHRGTSSPTHIYESPHEYDIDAHVEQTGTPAKPETRGIVLHQPHDDAV